MEGCSMIASLMMYARPELATAHARFWAQIRDQLSARGIDSPRALSQDAPMFDVWLHPQMVLSQTCSMPYRTWLKDQVTLLGTLDYGVAGCPEGYYKSALVVRRDETRQNLVSFKESVFAFNQTHSQSGYAAPFAHARARGFWFENRLETGAHVASAQAVVQGQADVAALDAVSWRLMQRYDKFAQDLRVLEWTEPTPGLPLITGANQDADAVFEAVSMSIETMSDEDKNLLGIKGLVRIPKAKYLALETPPDIDLTLP